MTPDPSARSAGDFAADTDTADWVRVHRPRPDAALRLVCFPHAGGAASAFYPWAVALDDVEVLAVQYPGRQDRRAEPLVRDLARLAALTAPAVAAVLDDGRPYAFFGHSMGAALAFEVARLLEGQGRGPSLLAVSGRRAPSLPATIGPVVLGLDDPGLAAHLGDLSGTDPRLLADPEVRQMILPVIRADLHAAETHLLPRGTTVRAPILALTGDSDPWATVTASRAWAAHTTGGFEFRALPGGHFYLVEHQREVLSLLTARLSAAAARTAVEAKG
ncbi:thioesterase II family protein [Actinacidiphila paucisporea]|uniref:Surfactin synthase thioesterase subunit n=1 Tax=Actinacidiphila paucisporea TaxID=310782 RepID=A0A1M7NV74_9ACTN|nr:alpha/beta fold hydrolase [Actinacidiphila paucisporea]SHN08084.1 Surfactin synthase thioesterase subunit [Actinacidiphila paucisporea]